MRETNSRAKCLAILGTASDVGKSIVVTALCRIASDLGLRVAPFKAQNMSNNSFVTPEGKEIGRAQAVQAEAARVVPHVDMNPVLLKPNSNLGAQVVLLGRPLQESSASAYGRMTDVLRIQATSCLKRLRDEYDFVVMEGAGSCAEINLKHRDIVNFAMAAIADSPVVLVADIDRGGVFAQIVGTLEILTKEERNRVKGVIINRFRGDLSLFKDGIDYLERRTGVPVLGVIPYLHDLGIDPEDAVVLDDKCDFAENGPVSGRINIAVIRFPHISNFTDFAPLEKTPAVKLDYLSSPSSLMGYDIVMLPGTKNVQGDLLWFRSAGFESLLLDYVDAGGRVGGICGGYQMLGVRIADPLGVEGDNGETSGLGLLDVTTTLYMDKVLTRTEGVWIQSGEKVSGYEIHQGKTTRLELTAPAVRVVSQNNQDVAMNDGARTVDGRIFGTYLHGLFDEPGFRYAFLKDLRPELGSCMDASISEHAATPRDRQYNRIADCFRAHIDIQAIWSIAGLPRNFS
jgi:adenosylcobyric acid synthase